MAYPCATPSAEAQPTRAEAQEPVGASTNSRNHSSSMSSAHTVRGAVGAVDEVLVGVGTRGEG